jgi:hypothetical protein
VLYCTKGNLGNLKQSGPKDVDQLLDDSASFKLVTIVVLKTSLY